MHKPVQKCWLLEGKVLVAQLSGEYGVKVNKKCVSQQSLNSAEVESKGECCNTGIKKNRVLYNAKYSGRHISQLHHSR